MLFDFQRFIPLGGFVRHYSWGSKASSGNTPYIADLLSMPAKKLPWAEYWLGAHNDLPSEIEALSGEKIPLNEAIKRYPTEILGDICLNRIFTELPFLLKILSCDSPLSIQTHPAKALAERLHSLMPESFPDANHKPEIVIALSEFKALAGFRKLPEILASLERRSFFKPWLQEFYQQSFTQSAIAVLCRELFHLPKELKASMLQEAQDYLSKDNDLTEQEKLFLYLLEKYPGDSGALFAFLLNYQQLKPGEALFLQPGIVHAYLQGDAIECMAASDNVVRAGLTQKKLLPNIFLETADFSQDILKIDKGLKTEDEGRVYKSDAREFKIRTFHGQNFNFAKLSEVPGILLILKGSATLNSENGEAIKAEKGSSWLRPAAMKNAKLTADSKETVAVYCEFNYST